MLCTAWPHSCHCRFGQQHTRYMKSRHTQRTFQWRNVCTVSMHRSLRPPCQMSKTRTCSSLRGCTGRLCTFHTHSGLCHQMLEQNDLLGSHCTHHSDLPRHRILLCTRYMVWQDCDPRLSSQPRTSGIETPETLLPLHNYHLDAAHTCSPSRRDRRLACQQYNFERKYLCRCTA